MRHLLDNIMVFMTPARVKRAADIMEKFGVGALIWGFFQGYLSGYVMAAGCLFISIVLTRGDNK